MIFYCSVERLQKEKKYDDDFVEVIGGSKIYPKQGETGFEFDRTKEDL